MNKPILLLGPPASGKTTLMNNIISKLENSIDIDEIYNVSQLEVVQKISCRIRETLVVCSQLPIKDIPTPLLAHFEVRELSGSFL